MASFIRNCHRALEQRALTTQARNSFLRLDQGLVDDDLRKALEKSIAELLRLTDSTGPRPQEALQ